MKVIDNIKDKNNYRKQIKESVKTQEIMVSKKAINICVDFAMSLNNMAYLVDEGSKLTGIDSKKYTYSFMQENIIKFAETFEKEKGETNSYIG